MGLRLAGPVGAASRRAPRRRRDRRPRPRRGRGGVQGAALAPPLPGLDGPSSMELCRHLVEHYDGQAERVWTDPGDAAAVLARLRALPGFGDEKSRIFLAVLAKRLGVRPEGWEDAAAPFSDGQRRSVADVSSPRPSRRCGRSRRPRRPPAREKPTRRRRRRLGDDAAESARRSSTGRFARRRLFLCRLRRRLRLRPAMPAAPAAGRRRRITAGRKAAESARRSSDEGWCSSVQRAPADYRRRRLHSCLALQPAHEHGDGAGVVAETVAGAVDDA